MHGKINYRGESVHVLIIDKSRDKCIDNKVKSDHSQEINLCIQNA